MKEIFSNLRFEIIRAGHAICDRSWNYTTFKYPFCRLYCITKGEGFVTHHGRRFRLGPNVLHLMPPHLPVDRQFCPCRMEVYYLHFSAFLPGHLDFFSLLKPCCHLNIECGGMLESLVKRLVESKSFKSEAPEDLLLTDGSMRLLLEPFARAAAREDLKGSLSILIRFKPLFDYIEGHLSSTIRLAELGKVAGLHPTYLSNSFSRLLGVSPLQYVCRRRIEQAGALLLEGRQSMAQIAEKLGFVDAFHFSKTFKKITGHPPSSYRKWLANGAER
ncbi:MAG: AraC family transcriptional regulator [Verrucomicrobiae bacterium]|nr:AraC family transcriptional regulator [Verrucomicrobiae bacterium]